MATTADHADLLEDLTVVDTEVHTSETGSDLIEYVDDETIREELQAGYPIGPDDWGPIPWDGWDRSGGGRIDTEAHRVDGAAAYDQQRTAFGVDKVVFSPGKGFKIFQIPDERARLAFMRAMNDYMVDNYALGDGTYYGKLLGLPEHPLETAAEVARLGDNEGIVALFMTDLGPAYPLGHRMYDPIYEACEATGLPIVLHGESTMHPGFPNGGLNMSNWVEVHTLCHPLSKLWHATSVIAQGVTERFDVEFGFWEAGQSWVQLLGNRMDREYVERPNALPLLTKLPSEYLSDFYYGTQPIEHTVEDDHLGDILRMNGLEAQLCLSTDVPHMDFDAPEAIACHDGLTREQKTKILQDNPRRLFGI